MASTPWARRDRGHRVRNGRRSADVVGVDVAAGGVGAARELGRVDALLDDPVFFEPFAPFFDATIGSAVDPDGDLSAVDVS